MKLGGKLGQHISLDAGIGEPHTGQKHTSSGTDPKSYFDLHIIPPGYQPKGEGECGYMAQYNQADSERVGHVSLSQLPT